MRRMRLAIAAGLIVAVAIPLLLLLHDPIEARAAVIAAGCVILWLSEAVPPFLPIFVLLPAVPLLLASLSSAFALPTVLGWAADPVLALFFGGFALGAAARRHRLDEAIASRMLRLAGGHRVRLIVIVMLATAMLSMAISNVAACALMIIAIRPTLAQPGTDASLRRGLLLACAFGANFGGMGTPVGTGPNAIAIAEAARAMPITFASWMLLAVPLVALMLAFTLGTIALGGGLRGPAPGVPAEHPRLARGARGVVWILALCVLAWLGEPLHHVPASLVALMATFALFTSGLLEPADLRRLDWSTLLLIAGGISLGHLIETSGLVAHLGSQPVWLELGAGTRLTLLVLVSAMLSALMSNTATAAMLIPLAQSLHGGPTATILVALGCSMGAPFVISTPQNAMVCGEGGLTPGDLARVGLPLMLLGCLVLGLTGPWVMRWFAAR